MDVIQLAVVKQDYSKEAGEWLGYVWQGGGGSVGVKVIREVKL